jgi:hypothetical protein
MVDVESVTEMIEEARRLIGLGENKRAADLLTIAAGETSDPLQARMILQLAEQGQERSGRFGRRRWTEAIRLARMRLEEPAAAGLE